MLKNFDETKRQLSEFAPIINSFKSEAVQLRIIELVFELREPGNLAAEGKEESEDKGGRATKPSKLRRRKRPMKDESGALPTKRRARTGTPMSFLEGLIAGGFFKKRQTIGQVVDHIRTSKARSFKPNEISGPLGRVVRDVKLKRERNADGQFEYYS